jgi:hypothetical protein
MQRDGVDADTAFATLVEASLHANLKLRAVAEWLVGRPSDAREGQDRRVSLGEQPYRRR